MDVLPLLRGTGAADLVIDLAGLTKDFVGSFPGKVKFARFGLVQFKQPYKIAGFKRCAMDPPLIIFLLLL